MDWNTIHPGGHHHETPVHLLSIPCHEAGIFHFVGKVMPSLIVTLLSARNRLERGREGQLRGTGMEALLMQSPATLLSSIQLDSPLTADYTPLCLERHRVD